jgi:serine/threonine-protein kinase
MEQLEEGSVLDSKFRVERVLGRGGMGIVVAATHLQLARRVALKLLLPEVCTRADAVDRFLREARAAVQIQSEHVARVTDVGKLSSGEPYMVMEYLDGSDLGQVLRARGTLPVMEAVDYVLQACEAIAEAHGLGIVHRDLKPANIFLTRRADRSALIKVLDFGISKALQGGILAESASATASAVIMGSPQYMSPEQTISSRDVDIRTDIWSLGMILHELLTGSPMFAAESPTAVLIMISTAPTIPLRTLRPDAPAELERVLLRCLEKDRTRRFVDVAAFARAIGPFASDIGRASVERIARILGVDERVDDNPRPQTSDDTVLATGGPWGNTTRSTQRKRVGLAATVAGACVVMALVAFFATRSSETAPKSGAAPMANETVSPPIVESPPAPAPPAYAAPGPAFTAPPEAPSAEPPAVKVKSVDAPVHALPGDTGSHDRAPTPKPKAKAPAPSPARPNPRAQDLFDDPK